MRLAALAGHQRLRHRRARRRTPRCAADLRHQRRPHRAVADRRRGVSAGVKSILDIGLTLETLETLDVPVRGLRHRRVPVVLLAQQRSRSRRCGSTPRPRSPPSWTPSGDLGLAGGVAIVNPIRGRGRDPRRRDRRRHRPGARARWTPLGIHGKEATPFLLGRIVEITEGASLTANIALVNNNARLGAQVAVEYAALRRTVIGACPRGQPLRGLNSREPKDPRCLGTCTGAIGGAGNHSMP